jgi:uncharacterized protein
MNMRKVKTLSVYKNFQKLLLAIKGKSPMIVAFSGGVDSSVVAKIAHLNSKKSLAVTIASPTLPKNELCDAIKIAKQIGIKHKIIKLNYLDGSISRNDNLRCYYCKKNTFALLKKISREEGITTIADGANADDLKDFRPGLIASRQDGVYSPLLEIGLKKKDVRELASFLSLPNYDKPAAACLSSRFKKGIKIRIKDLRRVEKAEEVVMKLTNIKQIRVRDHGDLARIEVDKKEMHKLIGDKKLERIARKLKDLGYKHITIDVEGYKVGGS